MFLDIEAEISLIFSFFKSKNRNYEVTVDTLFQQLTHLPYFEQHKNFPSKFEAVTVRIKSWINITCFM